MKYIDAEKLKATLETRIATGLDGYEAISNGYLKLLILSSRSNLLFQTILMRRQKKQPKNIIARVWKSTMKLAFAMGAKM